MNAVKLCLAVIVGFVLGAYFYHPVSARAAATGSGTIFVRKVTVGTYTDSAIVNREVVGFSCTSRVMEGDCYVALR